MNAVVATVVAVLFRKREGAVVVDGIPDAPQAAGNARGGDVRVCVHRKHVVVARVFQRSVPYAEQELLQKQRLHESVVPRATARCVQPWGWP